jgi:hypothetical protein
MKMSHNKDSYNNLILFFIYLRTELNSQMANYGQHEYRQQQ